LTVASPSAIAFTGSFTPVLECTQVMATIRVRSVTAASSRPTIWPASACSGSS
jgi:hypothetical protein